MAWPFNKKKKVEVKDYDAKSRDAPVQKIKTKFMPTKAFLIEMDLRNGDCTEFTITTSEDSFRWQGGEYIIDESMKKWCASAKMYKLRYHQDCSIPLQQKIDMNKVRGGVVSAGDTWSYMSLNPKTLDTFTDAKLAEQAMKGQAIDEFLKGLNWKIVLIMLASILHLILFLQASGFFSSVTKALPF